MLLQILVLLAGFALLIIGGELLVRGSVAVAERLGVSPLIIGIVLVGFGTSMPELVISVQASMSGSPGIAVGNIVGSNISNVLLIVGISALVAPITISSHALKRDGGVVIAAALAFTILAFVAPLSQPVGIAFVLCLAAYLYVAIMQEKIAPEAGHSAAFEKSAAHDELHPVVGSSLSERFGPALPFLMAIAGLVTIIVGGRLLVDSAVSLAQAFGVSEAVIGLSIVAVGTSMPELVTSLVAAKRGHSDVAVGNVLGSCVYNILGIGGVVGIFAPTEFPEQIVRYDNLVMLGAAIALVLAATNGGRITRPEGGIMLGAYIAYMYSLWPH